MEPTSSDRGSSAPPPDHTVTGRWTALIAVLSLAAFACGDSGTGPEPAVPVSISTTLSQRQTTPTSVGPASAPGLSASLQGTPGVRSSVTAVDASGDTLTVDVAVVLIENLQFHRLGEGDCGSADACVVTERNRLLLQLPMDTTQQVRGMGLVGQLDADIYDELRFELGRVRASDTAAVDSFPDLEGASMLIEGSFNSDPFTLTSPLETSVALTLSPGLDLSDSPTATNVTLSAPVTRWFMGSDNTFMDPESAGAADSIAASVAGSFTAFPDRDTDGEPDQSGLASGPS